MARWRLCWLKARGTGDCDDQTGRADHPSAAVSHFRVPAIMIAREASGRLMSGNPKHWIVCGKEDFELDTTRRRC